MPLIIATRKATINKILLETLQTLQVAQVETNRQIKALTRTVGHQAKRIDILTLKVDHLSSVIKKLTPAAKADSG